MYKIGILYEHLANNLDSNKDQALTWFKKAAINCSDNAVMRINIIQN